MIDVLLTTGVMRRLKRELRQAGAREIGGVMAAEQIADGRFVVRALSVQRDGTVASFKRDPSRHRAFMRRFHTRNGNNPERFNYLGEWHSHPSFLALPSGPDVRQMQALIESPEQASSFLVLMVIKLAREGTLVGSVHAFRRRVFPIRVSLKGETQMVYEEPGLSSLSVLRTMSRFRG